jgi:hypothetical protein
MHPVIRIVTFIIFSLCVVFGNVQHLLLGLSLLAGGYILWQPHLFKKNWQMLRRMRWLFLSILIIYLWFTPGQPLLPGAGSLSPSMEGLRFGFYRICSLVFIVLAVNLLIKSITRDELIAGILWLLHPLRLLGLPDERFAVRIALTFDVVHEVQGLYGEQKKVQNHGQGRESTTQNDAPDQTQQQVRSLAARIRHRLWASGESAVGLFQQVCHKAEQMPCHEVVIPVEGMPPHHQWIYPATLAMACYWLHGASFL